VRRDHHLRQAEQGRVGGRLGGEHVERGAPHVTGPDGLGQGRLVDDAAPGHVDDADARLGEREQVLADEPGRLRRLGHVQCHEVGHLDEALER
jgi:hypothetical protein